MSNSSVTFSLTKTPPPSTTAFQLTPQSLRLMVALPSKPTRKLPDGSFSAPASSKSTVTGLATPRMVRSPATLKQVSLICSTPAEVKVMVGWFAMSRKWLRRCSSRRPFRVWRLVALIVR